MVNIDEKWTHLCQILLLKLLVCVCVCVMQARSGITEVHFLPFNPVEKRTAITYIDSDGSWHRVSKGAPEQAISHTPTRYI